jgi:hypothetical protein
MVEKWEVTESLILTEVLITDSILGTSRVLRDFPSAQRSAVSHTIVVSIRLVRLEASPSPTVNTGPCPVLLIVIPTPHTRAYPQVSHDQYSFLVRAATLP